MKYCNLARKLSWAVELCGIPRSVHCFGTAKGAAAESAHLDREIQPWRRGSVLPQHDQQRSNHADEHGSERIRVGRCASWSQQGVISLHPSPSGKLLMLLKMALLFVGLYQRCTNAPEGLMSLGKEATA